MKRIAATITVNLWVPDDRYVAPGTLNVLAEDIRHRTAIPLHEWAAAPQFAMTDLTVEVEVKE